MKQDIYFKNQFSHCRHMHHYTPSGYVRIVTTFHSGSPSISSDHSVFTIWFFSSALCRRLGHRGKIKLAALTLATAAAWCHDWFIHLGPYELKAQERDMSTALTLLPRGMALSTLLSKLQLTSLCNEWHASTMGHSVDADCSFGCDVCVEITAAGTTEYKTRCDKCRRGFTLQKTDGICAG